MSRDVLSRLGLGRWRSIAARFDWTLAIAMFAVVAIGLINLYSATVRGDMFASQSDFSAKFNQQLLWVVIGSIVFFAFAFVDYRHLSRIAWLLLGIAITFLLLVFAIADPTEQNDTRRWLVLGPVRLQPSELIKLALIVAVARVVQDAELAQIAPRRRMASWAAIVVPIFIVGAQPDLGTAILTALIVATVGYLTLKRLWPMVLATVMAIGSTPILWAVMHGYQINRVMCFLEPEADPSNKCYHTWQAIYAVGSGRLTGKGWHEGTQHLSGHLPAQWTDFPFAVWAEEWGFLGSFVLLGIYLFLLLWTISVALSARDRFGSVICLGVAAMLFWQVAVNIGMVLRLGPVVGLTLPLISYGGSSLLTFFVAFGLVASVSMRRHGY